MQRIATPLFLVLALPFAAAASGPQPAVPTQQVYTYAIELGADGRIDSLAPHGAASGVASAPSSIA